MENQQQKTYWQTIWGQYKKNILGIIGLVVVAIFCFVGVYAPFLASSKPILLRWEGEWYFPLFRYLFYPGFYTKKIDVFFNLMIFTVPLGLISFFMLRNYPKMRSTAILGTIFLTLSLFVYLIINPPSDPSSDPKLNLERRIAMQQCVVHGCFPTWEFELEHMTSYGKLNTVLRYYLRKHQHETIQSHAGGYGEATQKRWISRKIYEKKAILLRKGVSPDQIPLDGTIQAQLLQTTPPSVLERVRVTPTLWHGDRNREAMETKRQKRIMMSLVVEGKEGSHPYLVARSKLQYLRDKRKWLEYQSQHLDFMIMPLLRWYHWEDDAGGEQSLNQYIDWWQLTRINRKDLLAALIFGVRISLVVGILAVGLSMMIGVPIGALAGYYGGRFDIIVSRLLEIWESMPTFFMLLMVVAMTQTKSIFLVITVVGIFGWTGFSRYIRGEFFKQRNLPYVEACHSLGFKNSYIMFSHILPNAIPPLLTLLPFAIMGAITSEAGLSFLGLGEEGSCSWGVLMDEGRSAFPGESYLLWPPAILLTLLLIAIALVGDALRDALDPKLHQ